MRKVCKKFADKFVKLLFALIIVITETVSPLAVLADSVIPSNIKKGDVYNPVTGSYGDSATITDGNSDVLGGVSVSKTVSKVLDEDGNVILGRYNVKFDVVGKNIDKPDVVIKPIYVVIVFDTSGSMICDSAKGGYSTIVTRGAHYTASDGTKIACVNDFGYENKNALTRNKWVDAIKGASDFADALIAKDTNNTRDVAFVSLVTFSGSATEATEFKSKSNLTKDGKVFDEASFGHPYGGTDLAGGIKEAARKLDTVDDELDAQKFILVISDGEPTYYYGRDGKVSKAIKYAKKEATMAKNAGTSIYAIGYGISDTSNAASVLKYVSSNTTVVASNPTGDEIGTYDNTKGFYYNADTSSIASALNSVFDSMVPKLAGTEATLVDTLGGNFVFTDSSDNHVDGNTYTYEIGDITEDGISFNFNIDINPDVPTGLYDTNSTYKLSYVDADSNSKDITPSKNPQVYWEANKYTYEIRYYKDVITDPSDSLHYINKVTGDSVKDKVIDVELDKYILDGYTLAPDNPTSLIVSTDNSSNIINVLYVKRSDLSYTVRYYQDDLNNMIGSSSVSNVTYGDVIKLDTIDKNAMKPIGYKDGDIQNEEDLVIKVNGNYIDVLYTKDTFSYTVRYFYENVSYDSEESKYYENTEYMYTDSAEYNEKITNYIPHLEDGFRFEKVNPSELIVSSVEEDNVIRVYYVRNNYKFVIRHFYQDLNGNYNENKDYTIVGEAKFGTTLKSSDYEKHETDGYVFDKVDPSLLEIKSNNDNKMIFYYNLRSDLSYTVRYYQDDLNNMIGSYSVNDVTYGDVIKLDTIDKNAMRPYGYKDGVIQNEEDLAIKVNDNYIDVLYVKKNGNVTEEALSKGGDNDLDNVNNSVDYNIRYASVIKDYVGKVTLTIVDELPYAIDLNKSNILDGIYDSKNNTITYIEVFDINEDNQVINFDREISISYIDIDSDIITNKVTSKVVLESDVTSYCEDEVDTSVLMGKVIVKYVDRDGVELANSIEMTDLVGKLYNTYALEIKDYHLYSEPSNKDGSYTSDEIVVTYVYEKDGMGNDNPPHTGVSNYNNTYFSVLLLGVLVLIKKYVK